MAASKKAKEIYENWKNLLTKELLIDLMLNQNLSMTKIAKQYKISPEILKRIINEYGIIQDKTKVRSQAHTGGAEQYLNELKEKCTKEQLYQYYIVEDHGYDEVKQYFNITDYAFNKLLDEYNIAKDRSISGKRGMQTKYEQAGGKENYMNSIQEKATATIIEKYDTIENFRKHISEACKQTWQNMDPDIKAAIIEKQHSNGAGWNHEKIRQTLWDKYKITNAYQLAKFDNDTTFNSKVNQSDYQLFKDAGLEVESEFRLESMRFDFKYNNYLIEIDPWPFHNSSWTPTNNAEPKDPYYHRRKSQLAERYGYECIHIFDWDSLNAAIEFLKPKQQISLSDCTIKEIETQEAKDFLNQYHIQGYARGTIKLGLFYNEQLIEVMIFNESRFNKTYQYELVRHAKIMDCVDGSKTLFNYFVTNYNPESIVTYRDKAKYLDDILSICNFKYKMMSQPTAHWLNIHDGKHITNKLLNALGYNTLLGKQYGYIDEGTDVTERMLSLGFVQVYDCGQATYIWTKQS